jgi:methyl-accepting chemotaxis protein
MNWYKNLKVSKKLLIGFAVVSFITLIIGLFSYSKTSSISNLSSNMADKQAPSILYLGNIDAYMNAIAVCERGLLNDEFTKRNIRSAQYNVLYQRIAKIDTSLQKYEAMIQGSPKDEKWEAFLVTYKEWRRIGDAFLELNKEKDKLIAKGVPFESKEMKDLSDKMLNTYLEERPFFVKSDSIILDIIKRNWEQITLASQESKEIVTSSILWIILLTISGLVIAVVIGIYISKLISKPIREAMSVMGSLSVGSLKEQMTWDTKDELGDLARSMNSFTKTLKGFVGSIYATAAGDFSYERKIKDERNDMAPALETIVATLNGLKNETDLMIQEFVDGNTDYKGSEEKFKGGYRTIVEGFNKSVSTIITVVREGTEVMGQLSNGDLTARMKGEHKNSFKVYQNNINHLGESLEKLVSEITDAVAATASASNQISSSTEEMAAGAQEQSAQAAEVATAVEEMTTTILETTKNADHAAKAAKDAGTIAKDGGKVVYETVEGMVRIADVVKKSAETVQELGKSSDQIGEIVQVIDDIADQTNLLALNAAIEAARAGEQGRGFAVVADEVRKLAERTTKATKEIAGMIKRIQKETSGAVESMQQGTTEVEKGKQLADKAGQSLKEIINGAEQVVSIVTQVAAASQEQSSAAEQISKNIESISNVTHESAAGVQQIARASEDLNRLTENLQNLISQFKISDKSNSTYQFNGGGSGKFTVRSNGSLIKS